MPISLQAAALRTAMERALDEPVHALRTPTGLRLHAPAPAPRDARWGPLLDALRSGDRWGSSDGTGTQEIWAEVLDGAA